MRRGSEDLSLRPFASPRFDAQAYVRGVLGDRRSEEVLAETERQLAGVNEEISGYIRQHKRELMEGVQDVTALTERYEALQLAASNLRKLAGKLRADARESLEQVRGRTEELERMHETAISLRLLRQFVHVRGQLEHQLKGSEAGLQTRDLDIRQLASASRQVAELEALMAQPRLTGITIVSESVEELRAFASYLRAASQTVLLSSLQDQDQASLTSALQVFFQLGSLPEAVLLAIDHTVRLVADVLKEVVDVSALAHPGETGSARTAVSTKRNPVRLSHAGGARKETEQHVLSAAAVREVASNFDGVLFDYSQRLLGVQQALAQKEDPASRTTYLEVLRSQPLPSPFARHRGGLVRVFWERLAVSLQEVFQEKLRAQPGVTVRLYPSLRRVAAEVTESVEVALRRETGRVLRRDEVVAEDSGADVFGCRLVAASMRGTKKPFSSGEGVPPGPAANEPALPAAEESSLLAGLASCRDRFLHETFNKMTAPVFSSCFHITRSFLIDPAHVP